MAPRTFIELEGEDLVSTNAVIHETEKEAAVLTFLDWLRSRQSVADTPNHVYHYNLSYEQDLEMLSPFLVGYRDIHLMNSDDPILCFKGPLADAMPSFGPDDETKVASAVEGRQFLVGDELLVRCNDQGARLRYIVISVSRSSESPQMLLIHSQDRHDCDIVVSSDAPFINPAPNSAPRSRLPDHCAYMTRVDALTYDEQLWKGMPSPPPASNGVWVDVVCNNNLRIGLVLQLPDGTFFSGSHIVDPSVNPRPSNVAPVFPPPLVQFHSCCSYQPDIPADVLSMCCLARTDMMLHQ
jgi:hypothetical protein